MKKHKMLITLAGLVVAVGTTDPVWRGRTGSLAA